MKAEALIKAVFKVGGGRGFLVEDCIVTAVHCLPRDIPVALCLDGKDYPVHVEPLVGGNAVPAELRYADPISDVAVLGAIDDYYEEWLHLIEGIKPFELSWPDHSLGSAKVLSLTVPPQWLDFGARAVARTLALIPTSHKIQSGMSGSPVLDASFKAIGLVSTDDCNPVILPNVPPWIMRELGATKPLTKRAKDALTLRPPSFGSLE